MKTLPSTFKIVIRESEYSYKRGFRCQFPNNIFQLWFHFQEIQILKMNIKNHGMEHSQLCNNNTSVQCVMSSSFRLRLPCFMFGY